jgi:hypothetical protein
LNRVRASRTVKFRDVPTNEPTDFFSLVCAYSDIWRVAPVGLN